MFATRKDLIKEQIVKCNGEILFTRIVFALVNCLSLLFVGLIFRRLLTNAQARDEDYIKLLEVAGALIAPYLTLITQGYTYPKWRKINVLRHLLLKSSRATGEQDIAAIYDK